MTFDDLTADGRFFHTHFCRGRRKTPDRTGSDPVKSVAEEGLTMKREDITKQFPDATKEQIDALMAIHGEDINKAKGDKTTLEAQLREANEKLAAAQGGTDPEIAKQIRDLKKQVKAMEDAATVRTMREKVAKETGVPANFLTGETEEECTKFAKDLQDWHKSQGPQYPALQDGGEVTTAKPTGADSAWNEFAAALSNTD